MTQEAIIVALATAGPVIGSAIGVWRRPTTSAIHNILYFAAGIMVAISFLDLIPESIHLNSTLTCVTGLIVGSAAMFALDRLFPHIHDCAVCGEDECQLGRTAKFLILAIFLHNFPEGMAIAVGTTSTIGNSVVIAAAIAIHNIPEGICTSAPYYYASGKRLKSFIMSSISAIPIIAGFMVVRFWLLNISPFTMSILIGATAGLMIYIAADQLMPAVQSAKNGRLTMLFFMLGIIAVMLLELIV
jgi:zinc transporter, ZIP family